MARNYEGYKRGRLLVHEPSRTVTESKNTNSFIDSLNLSRRNFIVSTLAAGASICVPCSVSAQGQTTAFPSRPLRFIVPMPPGVGADLTARYYAQRISDLIGQPIIVDNRPGANGFIGAQAALAAPADGYTIFIGSNSNMAANAVLFEKPPYSPAADFAALHGMMTAPMIVLVSAESPYRTLADLIEDARRNPEKLNFASGTQVYQLVMELFALQAGIKFFNVPFKGSMDAAKSVLGGETTFTITDPSAPLALIKADRLRALAVAAPRRLSAYPAVPTTTEAGLKDFNMAVWVAAFVRTGTPTPLLGRLSQLFAQVANSSVTREHYAAQGTEPFVSNSEELHLFQLREIELMRRAAKAAKIEPK